MIMPARVGPQGKLPREYFDSSGTFGLPVVHTIKEWNVIANDVVCVTAVPAEARFGRLRAVKEHNMVIHRKQCGSGRCELVLVNPIRLDGEGFLKLDAFGDVSVLIRLNPAFGQDVDGFYLARYPSVLRCAPGADEDPLLPVHHAISEGSFLDKRSRFFVFRNTARPEAALLLERKTEFGFTIVQDNILITADSLHGRCRSMIIPRPWRRTMSNQSGWWRRSGDEGHLREEFERLLKLDFSRHIGATGDIAERQAKQIAVMAVERAFYKQL